MKQIIPLKPGPVAFFLMTALWVLFAGLPVIAQEEDNPNLDRIPAWVFEKYGSQNNPQSPLSSIITINNWDNFNLGTDFGESNMAANMSIPKWYFTAYNTNAGHHTENGIDWANVVPNFGTSLQGDPVVAYDSLGNLFYQNMYGNITGTKVIRSTDNGITWSTAVTATNGNDKNWIACDQTSGPYANYVYATMTNNGSGYFSRSMDHGATWQNTFNPSTQSLPGMMPCVGPLGDVQGGAVYVVTNGGGSFNATYTFYRSTNGGQSFTQMSSQNFAGYVGSNVGGRNSVQNMRTRPYPFITADNSYGTHRGRFYLIYASNDPPGNGNKPDIWCRYSDDGAATFSMPVRVNDDANPQTHHQWHPATWCDKETGRLYVMWMDTRDCPTNDSALIYATYSDDGGQTFVTNQQISNKKMKIDCGSCGGGGTPRYQGDYNGIVSNKKVAMAGWTDFRQGSFMSVTAYIPDFAMSTDKTVDTLYIPNDNTDIMVNIPAVKLYNDTVVLSAAINPVPTAGSITFSYPQGNQITSLPGGKPVRVTLSGNVPLGNYKALLDAAGTNGTPAHRREVTIKVLSSNTVNVNVTAAPDTMCSGSSSQLDALVTGGTPPYTYAWTPSTGLSNPNIQNPVANPGATTTYKVTVTDSQTRSGSDSTKLVVTSAPATPGNISGSSVICLGNPSSHSIAAVPYASNYTWTVPAGGTITSGQGTITITVSWSSGPGGDIGVIASNSCGSSTASIKNVSVTSIPAAPAAVLGPVSVCKNTDVNYSVDPVAGATTYFWSVPTDAVIKSGQNTNAIVVTWGQSAGNVIVDAQNACGTSPQTSKSVVVGAIPGPAGSISGKDTVCREQGGYQYSVAQIPGATSYNWTVPTGATITSGTGTQNITVSFASSAVNGNITVAGNSGCGDGPSSSKGIVTKSCTGIGEKVSEGFVSLYPNPTNGNLNITFQSAEKKAEIIVMNASGKIVMKQTAENLQPGSIRHIDLSTLPQGVYLVKVVGDNRFQTEKITRE